MHILLINRSDQQGGAAVVTRRLACGLQALQRDDVEVRMLVQDQQLDDAGGMVHSYRSPFIDKCNFLAERIQVFVNNGFSKSRLFLVDTASFGRDLAHHTLVEWADVIILGWINQSAMSLRGIESLLRTGKQVIWVLHDLWPLTGVCHHPYDCRKYQQQEDGCGSCKYLNSNRQHDLSTHIFKQKQTLYRKYTNLQFVAVSQWVKECTQHSALVAGTSLRCEVIPNALPMDVFTPKDIAPKAPSDPIIMIMGAARLDTAVKGFSLLIQTLRHMHTNNLLPANVQLLLYGGIRNKTLLDQIPIHYIYKGVLSSQDEVADLYAQSDIVLSCADYETFGATLAEGIAAGCLAVTKGTGGQRDIVDHLHTGYIVENAEPYTNGILWAVNQVINERASGTALTARQHRHRTMADRFAASIVANAFLNLIE